MQGFEPGGEYSGLSLSGEELSGTDLAGATFAGCSFTKIAFDGVDAQGVTFERCRFSECDLSNMDASDSRWDTVIIQGSKLLGVNLADAVLRSLQAWDCLARLVGCFGAGVRDATFKQCDLAESDWRGSRLSDVAVVDCDLSGALFQPKERQRVDIRGSRVNGSFGLSDIRGVRLGTDQLLVLASAAAREAGATVDDDSVADLDELPGGRKVVALQPRDPEVGLEGVRQARAQLEGRQ